MSKNRFVLDTNIWVSAAITHKISLFRDYISENDLTIYTCPELFLELEDVLNRPKLRKYLRGDVSPYLKNINKICHEKIVDKRYNKAPDKDDNYLYDLCIATKSTLVTGDKLLLAYRSEPPVKTISKKVFLEYF